MTRTHEFKVGDTVGVKPDGDRCIIIGLHDVHCWVQFPDGAYETYAVTELRTLPPAPRWPESVTLVLMVDGSVHCIGPSAHIVTGMEVARRVVRLDDEGPSLEEMAINGISIWWDSNDALFRVQGTHREGSKKWNSAVRIAREEYLKRKE